MLNFEYRRHTYRFFLANVYRLALSTQSQTWTKQIYNVFYKNMHIYDTDILNVPGIGFKKNAYTPIFDMISDNLYI